MIDSTVLPLKRRNEVIGITDQIINNLTPAAMNELLGGYGGDLDKLFDSIVEETHRVTQVNFEKINKDSVQSLDNVHDVFDESLKINNLNYFAATTLPNFTLGDRNIEWNNLLQTFDKTCFKASRGSGKSYNFCFEAPLWRMYRYNRPTFNTRDTRDNRNSKDTVMITNESKLARIHLSKIVEEIRMNDLLHDKLLPNTLSDLGKDQIRAKNGATIQLRSKGSFIRGLHVGGVFIDDFLDKSCIYSSEQRDKFEEVFYGDIMSILEPGGMMAVSGTPFHEKDLYSRLTADPRFATFIYPGIYPDGRILAPDRHTLEYILSMKDSMGSIVFSREVLVMPVSDASSLFPWEWLNKSFIGMDEISIVDNIESYAVKGFDRVIMGCDFAISGQIGADYTVYTVWGLKNGKYYLIGFWRKQGASHQEQVTKIVQMNQRFKPNKIIAEENNFQRILIDLARERGVTNIEGWTTTGYNKKDLYSGLPSMSALFERGDIRMPRGNERSKEVTDIICGEFNSISFNEDSGKLESVGGHDDCGMSCFFAVNELRSGRGNFRMTMISYGKINRKFFT